MQDFPHYKSVFISDTHLGNPKNISNKLLNFLRSIITDNLIICGDFIDYLHLHAFGKLSDNDKEVIKLINNYSKKGTNITYIQGNHDSKITCNKDIHFENISITKELFYTTKKGQHFYITHGDCFDYITSNFNRISKICTRIYSLGIYLERTFAGKDFSKNHETIIDKIEIFVERHRHGWEKITNQIFQLANELKCDGIIMGHYHKPQHIVRNKINYYNTGDRLHNGSALIETLDGDFKIIKQ